MVKYGIVLYPKVYDDIDDIYLYVSIMLQDPTTAKRQTDIIWDAIKKLETFPQSHQDRLYGRYANKGYKQLIVNRFIVIYKIDEYKKEVRVVTVQYCGRNL